MIEFQWAVIDFDGTLGSPRWQPNVSEENVTAVRRLQQAGIKPVLCSGRPYSDLLEVHQTTLELDGLGPIVGCQGAIVIGSAGETVQRKILPYAFIPAILAESVRLKTTALWFGSRAVYVAGCDLGRWTDLYHDNSWRPLSVVTSLLELTDPPQKIILMREREFIAASFHDATRQFPGLDVLHTDPENLEFMSKGVNKAAAVALLAARYGINMNEVVAFGDGRNDEEVMEASGFSVAMGHAVPATKAKARLVGPEGPEETAFARAVALFFHNNHE